FVGTITVVSFLAAASAIAVVLAMSLLPTSLIVSEPSKTPPAPTPKSTTNAPQPSGQETAQSQPSRPTTDFISDAALERLGVLSSNALATVPPSVLIFAFIMLLAVLSLQFLKRLNPEPVVCDSPEFIDALRIWVDGVSARRETPRAVKRFVNRLRFMAMRLREVQSKLLQDSTGSAPLDEPKLVTFATIEDIDASSLGKTAEVLRTEQTISHELIYQGLMRFRSEFNHDAYNDPNALGIYRVIAGLVEERGGKGEPPAPSSDNKM